MINLKAIVLALCLTAVPLASWANPVNINTAPVQELAQSIKGIGEKKAEAIIAYREKFGPFGSIDELKRVKGIGQKTVDSNRQNMTTE